MHSFQIAPKCVSDLHWHPQNCEIGYIIDGYVCVTIILPHPHGIQKFELTYDDVYFIPVGCPHYLKNIGDTGVKILMFFNQSMVPEIGFARCCSIFTQEVLAALFQQPA